MPTLRLRCRTMLATSTVSLGPMYLYRVFVSVGQLVRARQWTQECVQQMQGGAAHPCGEQLTKNP